MNFNVGSGAGAIVGLMALWGIGVTIFWMVLAWQAVRAHERLAKAHERLADNYCRDI